MSEVQGPDLYALLGVDPEASAAEIKRAYRDLAHKYHPDKNAETAAEDRFKEIADASKLLLDPERRAAYDAKRRWKKISQPTGIFSEVVGAVGTIVEDVIGKRVGRRGNDLRYTLSLALREAALGCNKTIFVDDQRGRKRSYKVKIPPGTSDGMVRRVEGAGQRGERMGPSGDLHVIARVEPDDMLSIDGVDLVCEVPLPVPLAVLGGNVRVPTLEGTAEVRVPAGTKDGEVLVLSGRGLPKRVHGPRGEQRIRLRLELPKDLAHTRDIWSKLLDGIHDNGYGDHAGYLAELRRRGS